MVLYCILYIHIYYYILYTILFHSQSCAPSSLLSFPPLPIQSLIPSLQFIQYVSVFNWTYLYSLVHLVILKWCVFGNGIMFCFVLVLYYTLTIICSSYVLIYSHTSSSNTFYTCRVLHILIYIFFCSSSNQQYFDPACFIGVDG